MVVRFTADLGLNFVLKLYEDVSFMGKTGGIATEDYLVMVLIFTRA